ncbi:plasma-membrane choline transporter-domain-containing protein [Fimicolochytrium jonesii]|uniref:plasma-membrane choline transporter-domain-containing protein n=1 Tax=Fimicolochytrium jonesii TaxID=1396493 RepID=UPI0022FE0456|nr:plasma-membrane choline transporter-domain-containing protein [Fimicolochytrium jonesii]KAI8822233.1 plasma-membrane choline transporter-domain-containing protein [Fimicolochytrium jonesii]
MPKHSKGVYIPLAAPPFASYESDEYDEDSEAVPFSAGFAALEREEEGEEEAAGAAAGGFVASQSYTQSQQIRHGYPRPSQPGPSKYMSPYAEPSSIEQDIDPRNADFENNPAGFMAGPADSMLAKLLPSEDETPIYVDVENRQYRDTAFSAIYTGAMLAMLITGIILFATTESSGTDPILPRPIYSTLKDSYKLLCLTISGSLLACFIWLYTLKAFVRPVVVLTIALIPVTCIGFFATILTLSLLGKAHDKPYLGVQYDGMIGVAVTSLLGGVASGYYLVRKRREIDQTIHILQLSCDILRTNPGIFIVSITLTLGYLAFAVVWLLMFNRLFLRGWGDNDSSGIAHWHMAGGTGWAVSYYILMFFWTSSVFKNVEKVTIAGVVGEWYFQRAEGSVSHNRTYKNFTSSLTTSFGSICLASLILGLIQSLQLSIRLARRLTGSNGALHRLLTACLDCYGQLADNVTSYALVYAGLTGSSFPASCYSTTRVFRRNLVLGLVTSTVTRLIMGLATAGIALASGSVAFFFASRRLESPFAYVVGAVGTVIPYYLVQVLNHAVQNTVDATFMCYLMDVDRNAVNCESAHRIFGSLTS